MSLARIERNRKGFLLPHRHYCRATGFPPTDLLLFILVWYKSSWLSKARRHGKSGLSGRIWAPIEKKNFFKLLYGGSGRMRKITSSFSWNSIYWWDQEEVGWNVLILPLHYCAYLFFFFFFPLGDWLIYLIPSLCAGWSCMHLMFRFSYNCTFMVIPLKAPHFHKHYFCRDKHILLSCLT